VAAAALVLALAAPAALAQDDETAQVRVAHLSPDAPNVDVYLNDQPVPELRNVPFGTVSPYLPVPAGTQNVKVFAAGDTSAPVIEADVDLAAGQAYTVGAVGLVEDGSLTAQVYEDDLSAPAEGNARIRAVHAVPDAPAVDIVPEGGEPLVEGLELPNASPYAEVPAGDYVINVNAAGTDEALISAPVSPAAGATYSAFAIGTAASGNLDLLVVQDAVGGVAEMPDTGGLSPVTLAALAGAFILVAGAATGGLLALRRS
jgi:hypothetical protein